MVGLSNIVHKSDWDMVDSYTYRLKVPGGWLYRYSSHMETMVFVPEPKDWESTY